MKKQRIVQLSLSGFIIIGLLASCLDSDSLVYDDKFDGVWLQDSLYSVDLYGTTTISDTIIMYVINGKGDTIASYPTYKKRYIAKFTEDRKLYLYQFRLNKSSVEIDTFKFYDDDGLISYGYKTEYYKFYSEDELELKSYPNKEFDRDKYDYFNPTIKFYIRKPEQYLQNLLDSIEDVR